MKVGVLFYSETGNTSNVAAWIKRGISSVDRPWGPLELSIKPLRGRESALVESLASMDLIFLGTPIHGDSFPEEVEGLLSKGILRNKDLALFCTHGATMSDTSQDRYFDNAEKLLSREGNRLIFKWHCRGENRNTAVMEWLRDNDNPGYEQALSAMGYPHKDDYLSAQRWAAHSIVAYQKKMKKEEEQ